MIRERAIEMYLVRKVKALGGEIRKVEWVNRRGAPDRLVMVPMQTPFWVELKRPGGVLEPHQAREHERMRGYGIRVEVLDSFKAIDEVLKC